MRVIDLSTGISGGYCTKLLADAGCDVIKVEPSTGDPLRRWSASDSVGTDGDPDGALFRFLNTSKRSVIADAATPAGRERILELVRGASVVVENWEPGVAESLGLSIDDLRRAEPRVGLVSMSAFGRGGPMSAAASSEFTVQALSGSVANRGTADRPPLQAGGSIGDYTNGLFGALAALTFIHQWILSGRGDHLDVSMLEGVMLTHTTYSPVFASYSGSLGKSVPRTVELPSIEPAKDGWVGFCTVAGQHFVDFSIMVGHPEWGDDPEWSSQAGRQRKADEFRRLVAEWTMERTVDEIIEEASMWRIPVAPIGIGETIPTLDHFVERGTFVPNPRGGFLQPRPPYVLHGASQPELTAAPRLGQDDGSIEPAAAPVRAGHGAWGDAAGDADKPLRGLRVADFTAWWAGPFASHWCALMGADVIHVESPTRPDAMRTAVPVPVTTPQWWEWGPVFGAANTNKRGVAIDLTRPEGREAALRLVAECDVVIENYSPRVMDHFGLTYDDLRAVRPDIIVVRMPAFGLDGPWRDRTGFAQTMEQISGMAWRTGFADSQPLIPRGPCDPIAGAHATLALMVALEHRRRTGEGQLVEVTMVEAALNVAAEVVIESQAYGQSIGRMGNSRTGVVLQDTFRCADDPVVEWPTSEPWVAVTIPDEATLQATAVALGIELSIDDPLAAHQLIADAVADRQVDEVAAVLLAAGVPAAPVWPTRLTHQLEQPRDRGFFESLDRAIVGTHEVWGMPVKVMNRADWVWQERPAPTLGEHNDEVLGGIAGLSDDELDALREARIIGETWLTQ